MFVRTSSAFALALSLLVFTPKTFAQSYDQLEPLNEAQAERLETSSTHVRVDKPVSNFGTVDKDLYRSGQPASLAEMKALAAMGVKTIVNLQNDKKKIAQEMAWAKSVGIKEISIPLSGFWAPHDKDVNRIQALLNDKSQRPLLFHCAHGMERTGVEAALYRVFTMGWTAKAAYQEMKDYGFHSIVFPMKDYFEKKTGVDL